MNKGPVKVEQVNADGDIVMDHDIRLTVNEIYERIESHFPGIHKDANKVICGSCHDTKYMIRVKNITYLGHPHPHFKKRIQIPGDLQDFYQYAKDHDAIPILLGIYTYEKVQVYCDFEIEDYISKKANNSSAHIYSLDISKAVMDGYFTKTDLGGNHITVFPAENIDTYLRYKFAKNTEIYKSEIVRVVDTFFDTLEKKWNGIDCYKEMITADYSNKFQPEWPGFYLEYKLSKNIKEHGLENIMRYAQDKKKNGIDLDLYFPTLECYGDLKTHADTSSAILGNDQDTIHNLIDNGDKSRSIYYIVLELKVTKDSEFDYEVTHFWNTAQKKKNLMSYSKKMKHDVEITGYSILEINRNNQQYLKEFRQGKNSNGKPRKPKIMIARQDIGNFLIHHVNFI